MNIVEAMKERRSVRSFDGRGLTDVQRCQLMEAIDQSVDLFGGNLSIRLKQFDLKGGYKPSTYGTIRGAEDYFLMGIADDENSALGAGFRFEQVVLKAWQMGLGTCWIAATFKGSAFDSGQSWPDGQQLRIVCPVGVADKPTVRERLTRTLVRSTSRKSFDSLFFTADGVSPLGRDNRYGEALEMLRLAPSSTNSQPWRAIVDGDRVHFYYVAKSKASVLDCGIGICHFYETEKFYGRAGSFQKMDEAPAGRSDWHYLISYMAQLQK